MSSNEKRADGLSVEEQIEASRPGAQIKITRLERFSAWWLGIRLPKGRDTLNTKERLMIDYENDKRLGGIAHSHFAFPGAGKSLIAASVITVATLSALSSCERGNQPQREAPPVGKAASYAEPVGPHPRPATMQEVFAKAPRK